MTDIPLVTEELLEAVLAASLASADLPGWCADTGLPDPTNEDGRQLRIHRVHTFPEVGMLTLDRGVLVELSDGSAYTLSIVAHRAPLERPEMFPARRRTPGSR